MSDGTNRRTEDPLVLERLLTPPGWAGSSATPSDRAPVLMAPHRPRIRTPCRAWRSRRCLLCLLVALIFPSFPSGPVSGQRSQVDYAFVVDLSGSMSGGAGHVDIFPRVKTAIKGFVSALDPGTTLFFFPFAESIREVRSFPIRGDSDIALVNAYVDGLVADGSRTAVFNSIQSALRTVNTHRRAQEEERPVVFFVYTDGDDNVSNLTLSEILRSFDLERSENDWLYYTELGLPPDPEKQDLFESYDRVRLIWESEGAVQPIRQVEALLPFLNFGNLRETGFSVRTQRFVVRSEHGLPDDFEITLEPDFPELTAQGALADLSPARFHPEGDILFRLELINREVVEEGTYTGTLDLVSDDPRVLVVPNTIRATFSMVTQPSVIVSSVRGGAFPLELGEFGQGEADSAMVLPGFVLQFNDEARAGQEELTFLLEASPDNPTGLSLGEHLFLEGFPGLEGRMGPDEGQLAIRLTPAQALSPGEYRGHILLRSATLVVEGDGLEQGPDPTSVRVPWRFTVTKAPTPRWVWLLFLAVLVALGFLVYRFLTRPPTFADLRLVVLEPHQDELDLAGQVRVELGKGGQYLTNADVRILVRAGKAGGRSTAILEPLEGIVSIDRRGQPRPTVALAVEELFDGDVLTFDEYRVRVSSFSLTRD